MNNNLPCIDLTIEYTEIDLLYRFTRKQKEFLLDLQDKQNGLIKRLPCFPEDLSENIIKFAIRNMGDSTVTWAGANDLTSQVYGKIECKCFSSIGPLSFSPNSNWNIIYFLNAMNWSNDLFVIYQCKLQGTSTEWLNLKVNKSQSFQDQIKNGRRPRMSWSLLFPQIKDYCQIIFKGSINSLFH